MNQGQKERLQADIDGICANDSITRETHNLYRKIVPLGKEAVDLVAEKLRTLIPDEKKRMPYYLVSLLSEFAGADHAQLVGELLSREEVVQDYDRSRFCDLLSALSRVGDASMILFLEQLAERVKAKSYPEPRERALYQSAITRGLMEADQEYISCTIAALSQKPTPPTV